MNTRTRRLQAFMRALRKTSTDGDIAHDVAIHMVRYEEEQNTTVCSGLHQAVQIPEIGDE